MAGSIEKRLSELGITLPTPALPAANYVPTVVTGKLLFISGQLPMGPDGIAFRGRLGDTLSLEDGQAAARLCAINLVAQAKAALGDLDRIRRVVKLGGWVASTAEFHDQAQVVNGASNLMVEVFGDVGRHARFAVSAPSLPFGVPVEVDATLEFD